MSRLLLTAAVGLLFAVSPCAHASVPNAKTRSAPLIVVEDRGGMSALPHYQALNPQDTERKPFDDVAREFEYYNCQLHETGYYAAFYVEVAA